MKRILECLFDFILWVITFVLIVTVTWVAEYSVAKSPSILLEHAITHAVTTVKFVIELFKHLW